MEFRDAIAASGLAVALFTFIFNWARARGWAQRAQLRDELARFAQDEEIAKTASSKAVHDAHNASIFLSIELAEAARLHAAKRAARADAKIVNTVAGYGLALLALGALMLAATFSGWEQRTLPDNLASTTVFLCLFSGSVTVYVSRIRELRRIGRETPEMAAFRSEVTKGQPLTARDLKLSRPRIPAK